MVWELYTSTKLGGEPEGCDFAGTIMTEDANVIVTTLMALLGIVDARIVDDCGEIYVDSTTDGTPYGDDNGAPVAWARIAHFV
jgi:hypothetical protein